MNNLCLRYEENFETKMKQLGCVSSIIFSEKARKFRDFNVLLKKFCGRMIKLSKVFETKKNKKVSE